MRFIPTKAAMHMALMIGVSWNGVVDDLDERLQTITPVAGFEHRVRMISERLLVYAEPDGDHYGEPVYYVVGLRERAQRRPQQPRRAKQQARGHRLRGNRNSPQDRS